LLVTEELEPDCALAAPGTPERSLWAKTTYSYDSFGNKTTVTTAAHDVAARDAETKYDAQGRFPIWTENAKNHRTTVTHHPWWGAVQTATDPNQVSITTEFDGFGRAKKQTTTGVAETAAVAETFRRWAPAAGGSVPAGALYYVESTATVSAPAIEFFDKFGRSIRKLGIDGDGRAVAADTFYDSMGRAWRASTPFVIGHDPAGYSETLAFDILNRPLVVATPDEEQTSSDSVTVVRYDGGPTAFTIPAGYVGTTFQYNGLVTRVTRPHNLRTKNSSASTGHRITTRTTRNLQGWEVEVVQNEGNVDFQAGSDEQASVRKTYDALGQLETSTTCAGTATTGVTISHGYDVRGRRTRTTDPDMGTWTYKYNGLGELTSQTDAKSQTISMSYDELGRLTHRGEGAENNSWVYDTDTGRGIGKLHYSQRKNSGGTVITSETVAYDATHSRPVSATRKVDGVDYMTSTEYDTYGRATTLTYPGGVKVRNAYNAFSVLKEVRRQMGASAASSDPVVWMALPDVNNSASLAQTRYFFGNGVVTERISSRASGRLRMLDAGTLGRTNLQGIDLDYDRAGNVLRRADTAINLVDQAWYDALNRLTGFSSVQGSTLDDVDVRYDALGNITHKTGAGIYTYESSRPHAVASIANGTVGLTYFGGIAPGAFTYDANGNMTGGMGRTISYTAYNQISSIMQSGAGSTFTFSADRDRIKQVVTGRGTIIYGSGAYEKFTPISGLVEHTHYIMTPAGRTASYKTYEGSATTQMRYFHTDHLGSITLVTGEKGGVVQRFRYDPWGKRLGTTAALPTSASWYNLNLGNNGGIRRGFTDHEHLEDLGLVHMNGRIFDPVLGRFLSADPNIDGVSDSQGYNRYSYVHNNPLNATDPSGYLSLKDVVKIVAIVVVGVVTAGAGLVAIGAASSLWAGMGMVATMSFGTGWAGFAAAVTAGAGFGFGSGFAGSLLSGGSIGDAFRAGLIGAAVGAVSGGIAFGINATGVGGLGKMLAHGAAQGGVAEASGGEFRHGFITGVATGAMSSGVDLLKS
ncbi:MAG: hypothetical protein HC834_09845, partial [Rhodospirillales bacterium]|nr:hypothetical protein [Rhodospirillales bacterium]